MKYCGNIILLQFFVIYIFTVVNIGILRLNLLIIIKKVLSNMYNNIVITIKISSKA